MRIKLALALSAATLVSTAHAETGTDATEQTVSGEAAADWSRYARDLGGTRYSPLTQITPANVANLTPAWSFKVRPGGGGGIVNSATPIVVDNMLYLPIGDAVVALEADTGKEIWRHAVTGGLARRAVSYWPGDAALAPRIFYSSGSAIVALNAATGEMAAQFGTDGAIALDIPYASPPDHFQKCPDYRRECG